MEKIWNIKFRIENDPTPPLALWPFCWGHPSLQKQKGELLLFINKLDTLSMIELFKTIMMLCVQIFIHFKKVQWVKIYYE